MENFESPRDLVQRGLAPEATHDDAARWAVAHACLAPSELNSQPWRFDAQIDPRTPSALIRLYLDERRALPAVDPHNREAVLACGAALLNLRLALHGAGLGASIQLAPEPKHPELLAEVSVAGVAKETDDERPLRLAIPVRATHRAAFEPSPVPAALLDQLVADAAYEGAFVAVVGEREREQLAALNSQAEVRLWDDPGIRQELAAWSRANSSRRRDGVPGFARGLRDWQSWLEPARLRAGVGGVDEAVVSESVEDAPALLVVGAPTDATQALMRAGAGMQRLLLRATSLGLAASYLNASLHVSSTRRALGRVLELDHPEVVLRVGWASPAPPTPRRSGRVVLDLRENSRGRVPR